MNQVRSVRFHPLFPAWRYLIPKCSLAEWIWNLLEPSDLLPRRHCMPVVEWAVSFSSGSQQVALRQFDADFFRKKWNCFTFSFQVYRSQTENLPQIKWWESDNYLFFTPKKKERGFVWLETVCDLCWLHPENQITTKLECRFQGSDGSENTTTKRWRDCNSGKQQELLCPHRGLETCPSLTNISIIIYSSPDLGPPPGDAVDKICKNVSLVTLPCHQTTLAYPKIPM